jgi:uncharacterized protein (DUF2267 family)
VVTGTSGHGDPRNPARLAPRSAQLLRGSTELRARPRGTRDAIAPIMPTEIFQDAVTSATPWLEEVAKTLRVDDRKALRALRAGLRVIRDRLPIHEAVDLGAQLPPLIRGYYYEGWTLANDPTRMRTRAEFLAEVARELRDPGLDPEAVARAVIQVLAWHVTGGELDDIASSLPRRIGALWEDAMA